MSENLTYEKWEQLKEKYGSDAHKLVEFKICSLSEWHAAMHNVHDVDWTMNSSNYDVRLKKRPFEVGDLVVLKDNEKGVITHIFMAHLRVFFQCGYFKTINFDDIKTIRTLSKGGEEARAIVTMLATRYRNAVIRDWKKVNLRKKVCLKKVYKSWNVSGRDAYLKAKTMLK